MPLELITPPEGHVLDIDDVRTWLRIDTSGSPSAHSHDAMITGLMAAADDWLDGKDGILGRALLTQTWNLHLDAFPGGGGGEYLQDRRRSDRIRIPLPPLQSVDSVTYIDTAGTTQTLATSKYRVGKGEPGFIEPSYGESWPTTRMVADAVTIRFTAGYGARAAVPQVLKDALKMHVQANYDGGDHMKTILDQAAARVQRYKTTWL